MLFYFTSYEEEVEEIDEEAGEEAKTEVAERKEGEDSKRVKSWKFLQKSHRKMRT